MIIGDNRIKKSKANNKIPTILDRYSIIHTGHHVSPTLNIKTVVMALKNEIKDISLRLTRAAICLLSF